MIGIALIVFPKLALGLSGFETGVAVMPQISGSLRPTRRRTRRADPRRDPAADTAAIIMSAFLITSSIVTTFLIPQEEFQDRGQRERACAGLPGARVPRRRVRHRLRHQHDLHPLVRGCLRDGGTPEPGAALPAALRHGAAVGARRAAARARLHRDRVPRHHRLRRGRRCAGRRVRDRGARADHLGIGRGDAVRAPQEGANADDRLRRSSRSSSSTRPFSTSIERPDGIRRSPLLFILGISDHLSGLARAAVVPDPRDDGDPRRDAAPASSTTTPSAVRSGSSRTSRTTAA